MARKYAIDPAPDVKVKLSAGCPMCGRTDQHTHTQADWREAVDNTDPWASQR